MTRQQVRLVGGPRNGEIRDVDQGARLITVYWEDETVEQDWDGTTVYATRMRLASYRRVDRDTFEYCRTPVAIGDTELDLPERQLRIDDPKED